MLTKDKLKYLKENTSPIVRIDPPWYWVKMDLHIIGDAIIDLDFEGLRVHVVQEDMKPKIACNYLILSAKDAEDMVWSDLVKS